MPDDTLLVKPVEERTLPIEGSGVNVHRAVVDKPMRVPNTAYYRKALRTGDIQKALEDELPKGDE